MERMDCTCEGCEVVVDSLYSLIDVVVFQIRGFDVILGMDKLRVCHAMADCV